MRKSGGEFRARAAPSFYARASSKEGKEEGKSLTVRRTKAGDRVSSSRRARGRRNPAAAGVGNGLDSVAAGLPGSTQVSRRMRRRSAKPASHPGGRTVAGDRGGDGRWRRRARSARGRASAWMRGGEERTECDGGQGRWTGRSLSPRGVGGRRGVEQRLVRARPTTAEATVRGRERGGGRKRPAGLAGPHCALRPSQSGLSIFFFFISFSNPLFAN